MLTLREERMADFFTKWHVEGLRVPAVFHRFTKPDSFDPHDHPFGFTSFVLSGGYIEDIFHFDGTVERVPRYPGTKFRIEATHVHRIVELLDGPCETLILPGPWVQEPGFWQFREDGIYRRAWNEPEFTRWEENKHD